MNKQKKKGKEKIKKKKKKYVQSRRIFLKHAFCSLFFIISVMKLTNIVNTKNPIPI